MHNASQPIEPSPAKSPLSPCQSGYVARAMDVFSVVHLNQHAASLGPFGTIFFDDGTDVSFELSDCLSLHCILLDLRARLLPECPPRGLVMFLPGLTNGSTREHDCAVYVEVRERFGGMILGTRLAELQKVSASDKSEIQMSVSPAGISMPDDLLERVVAANAGGADADARLISDLETPPVLRGFDCACQSGVVN